MANRANQIIDRWCPKDRVVDVVDQLGAMARALGHEGKEWEAATERLQLAVIKLSRFEFLKMAECIELARIDWRDLFVAADFHLRVDDHLKWFDDCMRQGKLI